MTAPEHAGEEPLASLTRWEAAGGTWRLTRADEHGVELELLTCSGDEVMGLLHGDDPDFRAYVGRAMSD